MKFIIRILQIGLGSYALISLILFFIQEQLIFHPIKLDKRYNFKFKNKFEELNINTADGKQLNGLLFKAEKSKGLIFYLHGNAGSVNSWGHVAEVYTKLSYDVFILDYRGYGKSEGSIKSQDQLFTDNQLAYDLLKERYKEENIIVLGYSIGTGLASKLASQNQPKQLILQAPYYSLPYLVRHKFTLAPSFILKYKFNTYQYLEDCNMPITIFHGNLDRLIPIDSSIKLKSKFKDKIQFITLENQEHMGITYNPKYSKVLQSIL